MYSIDNVRPLLLNVHFPLTFSSSEWNDCPDANCYPYALGLKVNNSFLIGDFIGKRVTASTPNWKKIMVLKEEMLSLGLSFFECESDSTVPENYGKIWIQIFDSTNRYHFIRQDSDGLWSHKSSYKKPNRNDISGFEILDPDTMICPGFTSYCFAITID